MIRLYRRLRGDMTEVLKIIHDIYDPTVLPHLFFNFRANTRNNNKLLDHIFHYELHLRPQLPVELSFKNFLVSFVLCLLRLFHSCTHMTRGLYYSAVFISQLIDRADRKLFNQIQLSHHCLKLSSFKLSPSLFQVYT